MIGWLCGAVGAKSPDGCIIDVSGVGYRIACSAATLSALPPEGEQTRVWVHTHVREDAISLYGFATEGEQRMFEALIGVSGVGPRVALQLCSAFPADGFRRVLATDDSAALASVPGIGKKTASRILIDLKEKLALPDLAVVGTRTDTLIQARSALENLGYSAGEVRVALSEAGVEGDEPVEEVVKAALKVLV